MLASNIQHRLYIGLEKHGVSSLSKQNCVWDPKAPGSGAVLRPHRSSTFCTIFSGTQYKSGSQPGICVVDRTQIAYRIASESSTSFHFHSMVYEFYLKGPDVNFVMYFFLPFLKESAVYQDSALMARCP